jgi:hypothetical protein
VRDKTAEARRIVATVTAVTRGLEGGVKKIHSTHRCSLDKHRLKIRVFSADFVVVKSIPHKR